MKIKEESLFLKITDYISDNELRLLAEILDNRPDVFLQYVNEVAEDRITDIFGDQLPKI